MAVQSKEPKDLTNVRPYIPQGSHPIETGRYLLASNEINKLYDVINDWIDNRTPGGIVYGRPRLGKSRAINYLMHTLRDDYNNDLPIFLANCRQYKNPNEATFFEDLLKDVGHAFAFKGKASAKRERLFKFFQENGEASSLNRIVLFMDDAQNLSEMHYGWLMDIYNELDRVGIFLTVILIGQEELMHQRSAFLEAKKAQIIGRFMVHSYHFRGITTLNDIKICLEGYDSQEYPINSGWTFTRYFFPDSYLSGFKLVMCAEEILEIYQDLRQEAGIRRKFEIPMQYLTLAIEIALKKFGANGEGAPRLTKKNWKDAIKRSGYIDAELINLQ